MAFQFIASVNLQESIPPRLKVLTITPASFTAAAAQGTVIGAIGNKTNGSVITVNPADGRVEITGNSLIVGATPATAGTFNVTLLETLAGANGNPKSTVIAITVNA